MRLNDEQIAEFREEGYLVLPGAIPGTMIDEALRVINHSLGEEGMNKDDLPTLHAQTYCPECREHPAIVDLANCSPLPGLVESLIGEGNLQPQTRGQIALRFPRSPGETSSPPNGHLDGIGSGINGSAVGSYRRIFTGLAVILLHDVPRPFMENFTVWPKSHRFFEEYLRTHGHEVLADGQPQVDLPAGPHQITGKAGDLVITHHQIFHTAAPNVSPHIRYAAIFRWRHKDVEEVGKDALTDIWREWPGVRAVHG
jgi:hypothetical protein